MTGMSHHPVGQAHRMASLVTVTLEKKPKTAIYVFAFNIELSVLLCLCGDTLFWF